VTNRRIIAVLVVKTKL